MNGVDPSRLDRGYGLNVAKKKAVTINDCLQTEEKAAPPPPLPHDAILLQDMKTADAEDASQRLVACVKTTLSTNKTTQVIVSKATPTTQPDMASKRELFNALCFAALYVTFVAPFVAHDNAWLGNEGLHPTP